LARHGVIISKLPVLLDLASLTTLCADKTGTLTTNKLALTEPYCHGSTTLDELLLFAALAGDFTGAHKDAIDETICKAVDPAVLALYEQNDFVPFDPVSKRTESVVTSKQTGMSIKCIKGAPQILFDLADFPFGTRERVLQEVESLAARGLRSIGVMTVSEGNGSFLGIVSMHDPLRYDTQDTVSALKRLGKKTQACVKRLLIFFFFFLTIGVSIKMVSGDHRAICRETCRQLGLAAEVLGPDYFQNVHLKSKETVLAEVRAAAGFSEVAKKLWMCFLKQS
jgi:H+-transporting ATPase